jgi:hypothetical protein
MRLDEPSRVLVSGASRDELVAREHAPGVGVRHEDRAAGRVKQDRVHGLGAEAGDRQHLAAERQERGAAHAVEAPGEAAEQPAGERLEPARLQAIGAGGADDLAQLALADGGDAVATQQAARAQGGHGAGRLARVRVLGEHGAHRDLVRGAGGPPALRPEAPLERRVEPQQPRLRRIGRRARNLTPAEHS